MVFIRNQPILLAFIKDQHIFLAFIGANLSYQPQPILLDFTNTSLSYQLLLALAYCPSFYQQLAYLTSFYKHQPNLLALAYLTNFYQHYPVLLASTRTSLSYQLFLAIAYLTSFYQHYLTLHLLVLDSPFFLLNLDFLMGRQTLIRSRQFCNALDSRV